MEKHYKLPESVLRGILVYLGKRPFEEVVEAVFALKQLKEVKEDLPKEEKVKEENPNKPPVKEIA